MPNKNKPSSLKSSLPNTETTQTKPNQKKRQTLRRWLVKSMRPAGTQRKIINSGIPNWTNKTVVPKEYKANHVVDTPRGTTLTNHLTQKHVDRTGNTNGREQQKQVASSFHDLSGYCTKEVLLDNLAFWRQSQPTSSLHVIATTKTVQIDCGFPIKHDIEGCIATAVSSPWCVHNISFHINTNEPKRITKKDTTRILYQYCDIIVILRVSHSTPWRGIAADWCWVLIGWRSRLCRSTNNTKRHCFNIGLRGRG